MNEKLARILPKVQKPARYTGGEYGQIIKDADAVETRIAFCFPDTYEIGMSNLGMRILYKTLNDMPGVWCERVFAPWGDMEDEMRREGIPLYALESGNPVKDFDLIAFSLGYEMSYTNVLNMLDLAGLPVRAEDRHELTPIVFAGGTCVYNSEPMSDFIDLFAVGEGEMLDCEIAELYAKAKREDWDKQRFLIAAAQIQGVYVPSLYDISYNEDGALAAITPKNGAPEKVIKRIVENFDESPYPVHTIVPSTEIVHDRTMLELFRGCIRGCRFCQAGFVYRPVRAKKTETLIQQGIESLEDSGYNEVSLTSLSSSDYRGIVELCDGLLEYCEEKKISLALPSLRADNFSMDLMQRVQKVRRSGLTFAPEAGSQRLRDAINKNVTEEDLLNSCATAFEGGWSGVKLYFMMGLPTETDEDVLAIAELAKRVLYTWRQTSTNKNRGVRITVSTSCFIPKPFTPFQWEAQDTMAEFQRKQQMLKEAINSKSISYNWHDSETSYIEAVLARGDRRVGKVIEQVWRDGGKMDCWEENFSFERWMNAFEKCGVDPEFYALRKWDVDEILPWDMIDCGVTKEYLKAEREQAYRSCVTPDCRHRCSVCGINQCFKGVKCDE